MKCLQEEEQHVELVVVQRVAPHVADVRPSQGQEKNQLPLVIIFQGTLACVLTAVVFAMPRTQL